ncbi:MAG: hypothetical protein DBX60_02140 [Bacillota bacterium]|nr:MAG: hypothetical protein DBX60_02140 [Bacillota bacterium]
MAKLMIRAESFRLSLCFPVGMCLRIASAALKKEDEELHRFLKEHGREIRSILRKCRKKCGKFALVDIETADGDRVKIVV